MSDKILTSTQKISYQIGNCFIREEAVLRANEQMSVRISEAETEEQKEELRDQLKNTLELLK